MFLVEGQVLLVDGTFIDRIGAGVIDYFAEIEDIFLSRT